MKTVQQMTTNELLIEIAETAHAYDRAYSLKTATREMYDQMLDAINEAFERGLQHFLSLCPFGRSYL
jgi:L-serine deaminase